MFGILNIFDLSFAICCIVGFINIIRIRLIMRKYPEILERKYEAEKKFNDLSFLDLTIDDFKAVSLLPTTPDWPSIYPAAYRLFRMNIFIGILGIICIIVGFTIHIWPFFTL